MTTPKVLTPIEEMRSNFERTGTLAPMYARAMFVELTALTATNKKLREALEAQGHGESPTFPGFCDLCSDDEHGDTPWPCPAAQALKEEEEGE